MTKKPVLIVLVGLPGTGKSTFRNKLKDHFDFTVISSDDHIEAIAHANDKTYTEVFETAVGDANTLVEMDAKNAKALNLNVIWDQTNLSLKKRKKILDKFQNYVKIGVYFDVAPAELYRRLYERCGKTGKYIPSHIIENMAKDATIPSIEEGFDLVFWNAEIDNLIEYLNGK